MDLYSSKDQEPTFKRRMQANKDNPDLFVLNITVGEDGTYEEITLHHVGCYGVQGYTHVSRYFQKRVGGKEELRRWGRQYQHAYKEDDTNCLH